MPEEICLLNALHTWRPSPVVLSEHIVRVQQLCKYIQLPGVPKLVIPASNDRLVCFDRHIASYYYFFVASSPAGVCRRLASCNRSSWGTRRKVCSPGRLRQAAHEIEHWSDFSTKAPIERAFKLDHCKQCRTTLRTDGSACRDSQGILVFVRGHPPDIAHGGDALNQPGPISTEPIRAEPLFPVHFAFLLCWCFIGPLVVRAGDSFDGQAPPSFPTDIGCGQA